MRLYVSRIRLVLDGQHTYTLQLKDLLAQNVVLLRIWAGSVEHGFLAHFCPVELAPSLVLIECVVPSLSCLPIISDAIA